MKEEKKDLIDDRYSFSFSPVLTQCARRKAKSQWGAGTFLLRPKFLFLSRGELLLGREEAKGLGLPIPIGPHKGTGVRGSILPSRRAVCT